MKIFSTEVTFSYGANGNYLPAYLQDTDSENIFQTVSPIFGTRLLPGTEQVFGIFRLQLHVCQPLLFEPQFSCRFSGYIDDAPLVGGKAVIDLHHTALAIVQIGNLDPGSKGR